MAPAFPREINILVFTFKSNRSKPWEPDGPLGRGFFSRKLVHNRCVATYPAMEIQFRRRNRNNDHNGNPEIDLKKFSRTSVLARP